LNLAIVKKSHVTRAVSNLNARQRDQAQVAVKRIAESSEKLSAISGTARRSEDLQLQCVSLDASIKQTRLAWSEAQRQLDECNLAVSNLDERIAVEGRQCAEYIDQPVPSINLPAFKKVRREVWKMEFLRAARIENSRRVREELTDEIRRLRSEVNRLEQRDTECRVKLNVVSGEWEHYNSFEEACRTVARAYERAHEGSFELCSAMQRDAVRLTELRREQEVCLLRLNAEIMQRTKERSNRADFAYELSHGVRDQITEQHQILAALDEEHAYCHDLLAQLHPVPVPADSLDASVRESAPGVVDNHRFVDVADAWGSLQLEVRRLEQELDSLATLSSMVDEEHLVVQELIQDLSLDIEQKSQQVTSIQHLTRTRCFPDASDRHMDAALADLALIPTRTKTEEGAHGRSRSGLRSTPRAAQKQLVVQGTPPPVPKASPRLAAAELLPLPPLPTSPPYSKP